MPTSVRTHNKAHGGHRAPHYHVVESASGTVKSHHTTQAKAKSSQRAREGGRRGWKPTRRT